MSEFLMNASLEIRDVDDLRTRLLAAFDGSSPLCVDVTPVVAVDTAGLQLLLALRREARLRGVKLQLVGDSAVLRQLAANLGLPAQEFAA